MTAAQRNVTPLTHPRATPREIRLYYHSVPDFARLLGLTAYTVVGLCHRHEIQAVWHEGEWHIKPGELDRLRGYEIAEQRKCSN